MQIRIVHSPPKIVLRSNWETFGANVKPQYLLQSLGSSIEALPLPTRSLADRVVILMQRSISNFQRSQIMVSLDWSKGGKAFSLLSLFSSVVDEVAVQFRMRVMITRTQSVYLVGKKHLHRFFSLCSNPFFFMFERFCSRVRKLGTFCWNSSRVRRERISELVGGCFASTKSVPPEV